MILQNYDIKTNMKINLSYFKNKSNMKVLKNINYLALIVMASQLS